MLEALNRPRAAAARGLTLVELMIGLAFLGVLMALAAPSLRATMAAQRIRAINAEMVTDIQFARSEAVRLNRPVIMTFGEDEYGSCYTLYLREVAGYCQCTRGVGRACRGGPTEIKTQSLKGLEAAKIIGESDTQTHDIAFDARQGLPNHSSFVIDVTSQIRGRLRTQIGPTGRISVCSPDASVSGMPAC
jgi:type IV fimbrial biogenesis protein FimT